MPTASPLMFNAGNAYRDSQEPDQQNGHHPEEEHGPRFRIISAGELKNRPDPEWLVEGLFVRNTLAAIVGPHASFKSFVALSIAGAVASGEDWYEHETSASPVLYVSAEGSAGLKSRVMAWESRHQIPMDCHFITESVQMMDAKEIAALETAIRTIENPPGLIILDTLARCLVGGDENSARDMGLFIDGADRLRRSTGASVLTIHHTGKSGDTRGSTALPGAMDTIIQVHRDEDHLTLKCGKQKDAEEFADISMERRVVEIDDHGGTSLIFDSTESHYAGPKGKADETRARVEAVLADLGPSRAKVWMNACTKSGVCQDRSFYGHRNELIKSGRCVVSDGIYKVTAFF